MGTFDHLYVAMGIHLAHIHGSQNVALLTADNRVANIVHRCQGGIPANTVRKLKLRSQARRSAQPYFPSASI